MILALDQGLAPVNMALGAAAGIMALLKEPDINKLPDHLRFEPSVNLNRDQIKQIVNWLWNDHKIRHYEKIIDFTEKAFRHLKD